MNFTPLSPKEIEWVREMTRPRRSTAASAFIVVVLLALLLIVTARAETYRQVFRDNQGRVVATVDHWVDKAGTVHTTTRDAQGRVMGTAVTPAKGSTTHRDAQGRLRGTSTGQHPATPQPPPTPAKQSKKDKEDEDLSFRDEQADDFHETDD